MAGAEEDHADLEDFFPRIAVSLGGERKYYRAV